MRAVIRAVTPGPIDRSEARRRASDILSQRRFRRTQPGSIRRRSASSSWLDRNIGRPIGRAFNAVAHILFSTAGLVVIAIVVLCGAVIAARQQMDGRVRRTKAGERGVPAEVVHDPDQLDADAAAAQARGAFGLAVTLRFRAGLLRLDRAGAITLTPDTTSGRVGRQLRNDRYDRLAIRFDAVVYGDDTAGPDDADEARAEWPHVLADCGANRGHR